MGDTNRVIACQRVSQYHHPFVIFTQIPTDAFIWGVDTGQSPGQLYGPGGVDGNNDEIGDNHDVLGENSDDDI